MKIYIITTISFFKFIAAAAAAVISSSIYTLHKRIALTCICLFILFWLVL